MFPIYTIHQVYIVLKYWQWVNKYLATSGYCSTELCSLYLHRQRLRSDKTAADWIMIIVCII
jgi:hypothetical protein